MVQELFQYVYDAQSIVSILEAVVLWMADGQLKAAPSGTFCFFIKKMKTSVKFSVIKWMTWHFTAVINGMLITAGMFQLYLII